MAGELNNIIIGGSAIGLRCGSLLSDSTVFEEHSSIGDPVQCSGIVTSSIKDIVELPKKLIINKINRFNIRTDSSQVTIKTNSPNYILDRRLFDQRLHDNAIRKGCKIQKSHRYISNNLNKIKVLDLKNKKEKFFTYKNLIGADGPFSNVAKNNFHNTIQKVPAVQYRVRFKGLDRETVTVYPNKGYFAWIIPEDSEICRIGIISKRANSDFILFKKRFTSSKMKIIENQSGVIPLYNPRIHYQKENIFLVGDSCAMIKNTTGGGLYHGLKASNLVADTINERSEESDCRTCSCSSGNVKSYEAKVKSDITKDLILHYRIRNVLNCFKEKDWNIVVNMLKKESLKTILERYDRENPDFVFKMLLAEPRLLYFIKYIFHAFSH